jgi:hypothetical protein
MSILAASEKATASKSDRKVLCFYVNATSQVQVIRLTNSPNFNFERVIFPGQREMFDAALEGSLEVCTETNTSFISCQQLSVTET